LPGFILFLNGCSIKDCTLVKIIPIVIAENSGFRVVLPCQLTFQMVNWLKHPKILLLYKKLRENTIFLSLALKPLELSSKENLKRRNARLRLLYREVVALYC
jgi:hypothetical protein